MLPLEHDVGNDGKDEERYALLYDLQLDKREGPAVTYKSQPVGRHLTAIFEEGDTPGEDNDTQQGPCPADSCF